MHPARDGRFHPERPTTRAELLGSLVAGALGSASEVACAAQGSLFADVDPGSRLHEVLCAASAVGIVRPRPRSRFGPTRPVPFQVAAGAILRTLSEDAPEEASGYGPYLATMAARGAIPLEIAEPAQALTRAQLAELLFRVQADVRAAPSQGYDLETGRFVPRFERPRVYLPILFFHHIDDLPENHPAYPLALPPTRLQEFLEFFRDEGVELLTFGDLEAIQAGLKAMPEKPAMLTFDDGYADNYSQAFPLLEEFGVKGNFAIVTGTVGRDANHLSWAQVREIADAGHGIASHTRNHWDLTTLSDRMLRRELAGSKATLERHVGLPVTALVYPAGRHDARVQRVAAEVGYRYARTTRPGRTLDLGSPLSLPGVRTFPETGVASLRRWFAARRYAAAPPPPPVPAAPALPEDSAE